jgi:hypothetical protein
MKDQDYLPKCTITGYNVDNGNGDCLINGNKKGFR